MKLFFTIFGAILAAAAVIWAVQNHEKKTIEESKRAVGRLVTLAKLALYAQDKARGEMPFGDDDKANALDYAKTVAELLERVKPSPADAGEAVRTFRYAYEDVAERVGKKSPGDKEWSGQMMTYLERIKTAMP